MNINENFINNMVAKICALENSYTPEWKLTRGMAIGRNYISNEEYHGINAINTHAWLTNDLIIDGQIVPRSNYWITMKQADDLGAKLKQQFIGNNQKKNILKEELANLINAFYSATGSHKTLLKNKIKEVKNELAKYSCSQTIVKFNVKEVPVVRKNADGVWERVMQTVFDTEGNEIEIPMMTQRITTNYYTVFPIEAFDNLPDLRNRNAFNELRSNVITDEELMTPFEHYCEREGIEVNIINANPSYNSSTDTINIPNTNQFETEGGYYNVLYNLAIRSTAHENRLERNISNENIVGALGSLFTISELGYYNTDAFDNSLALIKDYFHNLTCANTDFIYAVMSAEKAKNYILNN